MATPDKIQVDSCRVGPIMTNCYVARKGGSCMVVDPGDEVQTILEMLGGAVPEMIFVTHPHFDHIGALAELAKATGAPIAAFRSAEGELVNPDDPTLPRVMQVKPIERLDVALDDGQIVEIGPMRLKILHTPGHHPAAICIYDEEDGILFSGDTLFRGTCGRTDFPGGNRGQMAQSLRILAQLPSETKVYPGHEGASTIANEKNWIARI